MSDDSQPSFNFAERVKRYEEFVLKLSRAHPALEWRVYDQSEMRPPMHDSTDAAGCSFGPFSLSLGFALPVFVSESLGLEISVHADSVVSLNDHTVSLSGKKLYIDLYEAHVGVMPPEVLNLVNEPPRVRQSRRDLDWTEFLSMKMQKGNK